MNKASAMPGLQEATEAEIIGNAYYRHMPEKLPPQQQKQVYHIIFNLLC